MTACFLVFRLTSECWTEVENVMGITGKDYNTVSLEKCKLRCANERKCVAIEFYPGLGCRIFAHTSTLNLTLWSRTVLHYYKLDRTCLAGKYACL